MKTLVNIADQTDAERAQNALHALQALRADAGRKPFFRARTVRERVQDAIDALLGMEYVEWEG